VILDYLIDSHKIIIGKDNRIVWIFDDNDKIKKLLEKSVPYKGVKK